MGDERLPKVAEVRSNINREYDFLDRLNWRKIELSDRLKGMYRNHLWPLWFKWYLIGIQEKRRGRLCRRISRVEKRVDRLEFFAEALLGIEYIEDLLKEGG